MPRARPRPGPPGCAAACGSGRRSRAARPSSVLPAGPAADARHFEPVLLALEAGIPTVQVARPGVVVIRAQGPARYFGGEAEAAEAVLGLLAAAGVPEARVGLADGPFAAEQAARSTTAARRARIVPPGGSAAFLAPLPVALTGLPELTQVLAKLGVRTLGAFAALPVDQVRDRFGPSGEAAHRVAAGLDPRRVVPRDGAEGPGRADRVRAAARPGGPDRVRAEAHRGGLPRRPRGRPRSSAPASPSRSPPRTAGCAGAPGCIRAPSRPST